MLRPPAILLVAALTILPGSAAGDGLSLPPDPDPPVTAAACAALHADYRRVVDDLKRQASRCTASASRYAQSRYARPAGDGECVMRVIGRCRIIVDGCTKAARAMDAALGRCRARLQSGG